jgi:hypothetical protein
MGGPPFFLADLSQPQGHGGQQLVHHCSSALSVCGKIHSLKYEPGLRIFRNEQLIFVHNIHLLGVMQGINGQGC